jgi:hypothetical protein
MRRYGRIDANQNEIVAKLRKAYHSVTILSAVGNGCPDILVGRNGISLPMEIKIDGAELTDDELDWHTKWKGSVAIVHSFEEAVDAMNEQVRRLK